MNEEYNSKALRAWNEWKKICSILGCRPEYRNILAGEVTEGFQKKLQRIIGHELDGLFAPGANRNWAHEFDMGVIETAQRSENEEVRQPKKWKDYIFALASESPDPPLQVIRGKLTGKLSIINGIAERYLRNNYSLLWIKKGDKKIYSLYASTDEKINSSAGGTGATLGDLLPAPQVSSELKDDDMRRLRELIDGKLTDAHAAILLVDLVSKVRQSRKWKKLSLGIRELLQFVNLSKSTCYARYNNEICPKLPELEAAVLNSSMAGRAVEFLISLLQNQLKPEKRAQALLLRVEKALNER